MPVQSTLSLIDRCCEIRPTQHYITNTSLHLVASISIYFILIICCLFLKWIIKLLIKKNHQCWQNNQVFYSLFSCTNRIFSVVAQALWIWTQLHMDAWHLPALCSYGLSSMGLMVIKGKLYVWGSPWWIVKLKDCHENGRRPPWVVGPFIASATSWSAIW